MTSAGRRVRLAPQARRAQLIELGVDMLATRTLDELPVELIAQEAGISRGLLFHYFGSKQEFYVEVARAAAAQMIMRTEPDPALPPVEALRCGLAAYVDYVTENPDSYTSLVRGAASGDAALRAIFDETRAAMAARILDVLDALDPAGAARVPATVLAVHGWVAYAEECVIHWIARPDALTRTQLVDLLARALPAVVLAASDTVLPAVVALADQAAGVRATPEPT